MSKRYSQEAIELCRKLYCKYGGNNYEAIEREMRKVYWTWSKKSLDDVSAADRKNRRLGWVTKFGFENSLRLHLEKLIESVNDDEQDLYIGIKTIRKELQRVVSGRNREKADLQHYRDFCKLEIEARRNLDLSRDNFETFVAGYEKLVTWLSEIDPQAAKAVVKHGDKLTEMAQAHYGKSEEDDAGTSDREDEGGK